ncbi:MAG TPA: copper-binding protein [Candidatus Binatia bacterium]|jgi:Cu/Ag efflux protein CusF|nr:copper-binding protein [Candidatus Binatia bacterium]
MQAKKTFLKLLITLILPGCASYQAQPLTVNHPAHPDAQAGVIASRSKTLAYTAADLASGAITRTAADSEGYDAHHARSASAPKTATGEGSVVAVVPATGQLVIQHGDIKDFMGPMTMGYPTEPASLLEGLKPGDKVRFSIDTEKKVIVKIEKLS